MGRMLREWRLRHHERLMAQAQEGGRPSYKRGAIIAASYIAWGFVVFWAFNAVALVGPWLSLLYWLLNPPLLVVAGCLALYLGERNSGVYVIGGKVCRDDFARLAERRGRR